MNSIETPLSLRLSVTSKCNLTCEYCSHFTSGGDVSVDLPKEEWLNFFEELKDCRIFNVSIEGGEPFIRNDLSELIEGIIKNKMRFNILSNGTLLKEEIISFISSTGRCDNVQISIDGSTSIEHDAFRGKGSFDKAVNGILLLQKYKIPTTVNLTIHKHNVFKLEEISKFLLEDLHLSRFSTNEACYFGLCRQNSNDIQLTVEEQSYSMKILMKLEKKYNGKITASAGPLANAISWLKMMKAYKNRNEINGGYLKGCGGVWKSLSVRSDGAIVPCLQMSHMELGRINDDNLTEIWQNNLDLNKLRDRINIPLENFEFCKECEYIPYCSGNCPALAYTITGMENHPSPDSCLKRFLNSGGILPFDDFNF